MSLVSERCATFLTITSHVGMLLLAAAAGALPIAHKWTVAGIGVAASDLFLAAAAAALSPGVLLQFRHGGFNRSVSFFTPLLIVAALSAIDADDKKAALKEYIQILMYVGVGSVVCLYAASLRQWSRYLITGLMGGTAIAAAGVLWNLMHELTQRPAWLLPLAPLAVCGALLAALLSAVPQAHRTFRWTSVALAAALLLVAATTTFSNSEAEPVAENIREAYAALSVLSEKQILGLGPGNYQSNIGGFYQGMAKTNTITPGTQLGWAVTLASLGLAGIAAIFYWWSRMWAGNRLIHTFLLVWLASGWLTPILVSAVLFPAVLVHGLLGHMTNANFTK